MMCNEVLRVLSVCFSICSQYLDLESTSRPAVECLLGGHNPWETQKMPADTHKLCVAT